MNKKWKQWRYILPVLYIVLTGILYLLTLFTPLGECVGGNMKIGASPFIPCLPLTVVIWGFLILPGGMLIGIFYLGKYIFIGAFLVSLVVYYFIGYMIDNNRQQKKRSSRVD